MIEAGEFCQWLRRDPEHLVGRVLRAGSVIRGQDGSVSYKITDFLGRAVYGGVFRCVEVVNTKGILPERVVAVKVMIRKVAEKYQGRVHENINAEKLFSCDLKGNPHIVIPDYQWESSGCVFIVMPYAEGGDMFQLLQSRQRPLDESEARWFFSRIMEGAHFIHTKNIGFRDYSLENILLFQDPNLADVWTPKIADLGQAMRFRRDSHGNVLKEPHSHCFGKAFRPPEAYPGNFYDPVKADVFFLGWILVFSVTRRGVFQRAKHDDLQWSLWKERMESPVLRACGLSHTFQDLIQHMLHPDFQKRYTVDVCLRHSWFSEGYAPLRVTNLCQRQLIHGCLETTESLVGKCRMQRNI